MDMDLPKQSRAIYGRVCFISHYCEYSYWSYAALFTALRFNTNDATTSMGLTRVRSMRKLLTDIFAGIFVHVLAVRTCKVSWFSLKWKVPVLGKLLNSAAARREFSRHRGLSFDEVLA